MEFIFQVLVKLLIIFVGGSFVSLIAYLIGSEMTKIPQLIMTKSLSNQRKKELEIKAISQISPNTSIYEIIYNNKKKFKIISSPQEMKTI